MPDNAPKTHAEAVEKLADLLKDLRICMMVTEESGHQGTARAADGAAERAVRR